MNIPSTSREPGRFKAYIWMPPWTSHPSWKWFLWVCGKLHITLGFKRLTAHRARTALLPPRNGPPGDAILAVEVATGQGCARVRLFQADAAATGLLRSPSDGARRGGAQLGDLQLFVAAQMDGEAAEVSALLVVARGRARPDPLFQPLTSQKRTMSAHQNPMPHHCNGHDQQQQQHENPQG
mmetsp:Transcript_29441/g.63786  ORF Transcript_29441/g.63786 Transcript_29441/m.63786 type:complete len:181 (+) Transcript_29441:67-609(+)